MKIRLMIGLIFSACLLVLCSEATVVRQCQGKQFKFI